MQIAEIPQKLNGVKRSQDGFIAKCPVHDDTQQSLTIGENGSKVLNCSEVARVEVVGHGTANAMRKNALSSIPSTDYRQFWEHFLCDIVIHCHIGSTNLSSQMRRRQSAITSLCRRDARVEVAGHGTLCSIAFQPVQKLFLLQYLVQVFKLDPIRTTVGTLKGFLINIKSSGCFLFFLGRFFFEENRNETNSIYARNGVYGSLYVCLRRSRRE